MTGCRLRNALAGGGPAREGGWTLTLGVLHLEAAAKTAPAQKVGPAVLELFVIQHMKQKHVLCF